MAIEPIMEKEMLKIALVVMSVNNAQVASVAEIDASFRELHVWEYDGSKAAEEKRANSNCARVAKAFRTSGVIATCVAVK